MKPATKTLHQLEKIPLLALTLVLASSCKTAPHRRAEPIPQAQAKSAIEEKKDATLSAPAHELKHDLEDFVEKTQPNRSVGQPGHEAAFKYIKARFEEIAKTSKGKVFIHEFSPDTGFAVKNYQNDFDDLVKKKFQPKDPTYLKWDRFTVAAIKFVKKYENIKGRNLILEIPGKRLPQEVIYVGAHFDTITHNHETMEFTPDLPAPGADDNASAVTALLATARDFATRPHDRTVRFVAFDYEEIFFLGSYALAKDIAPEKKLPWKKPGEKTLGLINLEMIGWTSAKADTKPVVKIYTRPPEDKRSAKDLVLAQAFQSAVHDGNLAITPAVLQNGFNRGDNWSFWQKKLPSICISQDWESDFNESHYHSPTDAPDTLNYDYLSQITNGVSGTIAKLSTSNTQATKKSEHK